MGKCMLRVNECPVFGNHLLKILPDIPLQLRAVKQCCRMICWHEPDIALLKPPAPHPADSLIGLQYGLGCTVSHKNHDLGLQQMYLHPQIGETGPDLLGIGSAVARGPALYYIENIDMLKPLKAASCQNLIQQLSCTADKGSTQPILICTGPLTADHELCLGIALSEHNLAAPVPQRTALTGFDHGG
jgi:hypothetical protein